jgi:hypothetical protein
MRIDYPVGIREEPERELLRPRPPWPAPIPDREPAFSLNADRDLTTGDFQIRSLVKGSLLSGKRKEVCHEASFQASYDLYWEPIG